jgi:anti-sigma regulatory factor (Ser/Thr protein kinase)/Fe-S-cluster-containing hydrogenase component 2
MSTQSFTIVGNDFDRAGLASHRLKEQLKKIGVAPDIVRRTIIAAYEAEMNVVIYARRANMFFTLTDSHIDVEIIDEGPGIADIEKAMQVGFSTAPESIRDLGFGAGLGLPNIDKASDLFEIQSTVGKGTRVHFIIDLLKQPSTGDGHNSLLINAESCDWCSRCLNACPTHAFRLRRGTPEILERLCIDCAECIGECKSGALSVDIRDGIPDIKEGTLLVVPESFFFQFGASVPASTVVTILEQLGFRAVYGIGAWEDAVRLAVEKYYKKKRQLQPIISPLCPTVLNLIALRFPSLIEQVAPFCSPIEAATEQFRDKTVLFAPACPGQCTAVRRSDSSSQYRSVSLAALFHAVLPLLHGERSKKRDVLKNEGRFVKDPDGTLRVCGIYHVINVLEKTENGMMGDANILELFACDLGCFGSPLLREDPYISYQRWAHSTESRFEPPTVIAPRRKTPLLARQGLRLDEDMQIAIQKLAAIDTLTCSLPGRDCGVCGAPTCSSFAEDVVLGRAVKSECIFFHEQEGEDNENRGN